MMDLIDFDNNVDDGVGGECRETEMWTSKWTLLLNNGSFQYTFHTNSTKDTFLHTNCTEERGSFHNG